MASIVFHSIEDHMPYIVVALIAGAFILSNLVSMLLFARPRRTQKDITRPLT